MLKVMEYTTKEKIDAIRGYIKNIAELTRRINNTDKLMEIFKLEVSTKITHELYNVSYELIIVIERLESKVEEEIE